MKLSRYFYVIIFAFFTAHPLFVQAGSSGPTSPNLSLVIEEARSVESRLNGCSGSSKEVLACVQSALSDFGSGLALDNLPLVAPKAAPTVKAAASALKKAKSKTAAFSVVSKARSILLRLSVKKSGEVKQIYKRVAITLARAMSVIKRKA